MPRGATGHVQPERTSLCLARRCSIPRTRIAGKRFTNSQDIGIVRRSPDGLRDCQDAACRVHEDKIRDGSLLNVMNPSHRMGREAQKGRWSYTFGKKSRRAHYPVVLAHQITTPSGESTHHYFSSAAKMGQLAQGSVREAAIPTCAFAFLGAFRVLLEISKQVLAVQRPLRGLHSMTS